MIEKWHDWTNSLAFKIIFALIAVSFVLGGIGSGFIAGNTSAVKVNGEEISQRAFTDARNRLQNQAYNEQGEQFWDLMDNPQFASEFNYSVLNNLVNDELIRQYAKELNLGVSVDQVKSEIVNSPTFQQDGKFNNDLYQQMIRNSGLTPDGYAAIVADGILFSQVEEGIVNSGFDVPAEQAQLAKLLFQKRQVRLAEFSLAKEMQNQTASSEELQAFYDANKAKFIQPEQMAVEYITLEPKDVEGKIQITDEQIATYYDRNKAQYLTKGESRLAHIQVASEQEAKEIEAKIKAGEDFAQLAQNASTDKLSATQGGDLGWAKAGTFPAEFEKAASGLNVGEVSGVTKVGSGYHLIKLLDRKAEVVLPLEQVKSSITKALKTEFLASEYSNTAREMANVAFENNNSLDAVAKVAGLTVQKTAIFTRQTVSAELQNDAVIKALFNGELRQSGQNSEALEVGNGTTPRTMFVRVSEYQAERSKTLDEAKAEVETQVKGEKAEKALLAQAEAQLKALEAGNGEINFGTAQTLVYLQAQADQPVLSQTVFAMAKPTEKPSVQIARNANGDVVIVALDRVTDGTAEEFKPLAQALSQTNRNTLRNELLNDLRDRASVDVNEDFMQQQISSGN